MKFTTKRLYTENSKTKQKGLKRHLPKQEIHCDEAQLGKPYAKCAFSAY